MSGGSHSHEISDIKNLSETLTTLSERLSNLERSVPTEPTPEPWKPAFPGDTPNGQIRWGCSYLSNAVPVPHESVVDRPVGVRRTFWRLDQATNLLSTCKTDHIAGRLPWVSIKLTNSTRQKVSWKDTAAGVLDAALLNLIEDLAALNKPVWFTVHHEPEGGGGVNVPDDGVGTEPDWRAMQAHVRILINEAEATNIAFAPILMSWTFDQRSKRNPADWWVDGIWDFAGIDHYVEAGDTTLLNTMWNNAKAFYDSKGLKIALGEWGNKDHAASGAREMQEWYDYLLSIGSPGACYFDTHLNGGVPLSGEALTKFRELLKAPTSVTSVTI